MELKDDEIFSGGEPDPTLIRVTGAIRSGRGIEDRTMILGGINQVIKALEPRAFVEIRELRSKIVLVVGSNLDIGHHLAFYFSFFHYPFSFIVKHFHPPEIADLQEVPSEVSPLNPSLPDSLFSFWLFVSRLPLALEVVC